MSGPVLQTMRAVALRLQRRGGLAGALVTHRSRTRLGGLGVVGSVRLLVQRSSAMCRWASEFDVQGHAGESRIDRRQSTRQMLYDEFGSKRTVPRACISDFLGKSPGDTSGQILILRRNAMCTHATRKPVEGAAPRRAGLGAPDDALQDQIW